ncbi:MAG TPA: hypothetical protein VGK67_14055 [Myxococcales bacterium]
MADRKSSPKPKPSKAASIVKTCGCGAKYTLAEWQRLPWCGVIQPGNHSFAELRICACGSSIAIRVRPVPCMALVPI